MIPALHAASVSPNPSNHVSSQTHREPSGEGFGSMLTTVMTRPEPQNRAAVPTHGHTTQEPSNRPLQSASAGSKPSMHAATSQAKSSSEPAPNHSPSRRAEANPAAHKAKPKDTSSLSEPAGVDHDSTEMESPSVVVAVDSKSSRGDSSDSEADQSDKDSDAEREDAKQSTPDLSSICPPVGGFLPAQQILSVPVPICSQGSGSNNDLAQLQKTATDSGSLQSQSPGNALLSVSSAMTSFSSPITLPTPAKPKLGQAAPIATSATAPSVTQSLVQSVTPSSAQPLAEPAAQSAEAQVAKQALPDMSVKNAPLPEAALKTDPASQSNNDPALAAQGAVVLGSTAKEMVASAKAIVSNAGPGEPIRILSRSNGTANETKKTLPERAADTRSSNSEAVGTGTAPHGKQMLREEQQNDFADRPKQILPERAEAAGMQVQPADASLKTPDANPKASLISSAATGVETLSTPTTHDTASSAPANSPVPNGSSPVLSRLISGVNHEAMILRQFKPDKLDVVLRPDSNTQISLQLRLEGDAIQGVARCEQGDYTLLSSHWKDLQRSMDQQGVHLGPLKESSAAMSMSGGSSFGNSSNMARDRRARRLESVVSSAEPAVPRRAAAVAAAGSGRTPVPGLSLLQTWA